MCVSRGAYQGVRIKGSRVRIKECVSRCAYQDVKLLWVKYIGLVSLAMADNASVSVFLCMKPGPPCGAAGMPSAVS